MLTKHIKINDTGMLTKHIKINDTVGFQFFKKKFSQILWGLRKRLSRPFGPAHPYPYPLETFNPTSPINRGLLFRRLTQCI